MASNTQESSPALRVLFGEILRHKRLATGVLVVTVLDSVLIYGVSPYLVSLFAEKVATGASVATFHSLMWTVAIIATLDTVLFFQRVRWRRKLSARGRTGLSDRLNGALVKTDATTSQRTRDHQGEAQKMQDAWMDLIFNATETLIPFLCGSVCLLLFVLVQAPLFVVPILLLVAGGVAIAVIASRHFNVTNQEISAASVRERETFDAMFAVSKMKWLIGKLSPLRRKASLEYESRFYEQAVAHARWQGLLLLLGGVLKVAAIGSGPLLMAMGYRSSVAVLIVLLGYALGDKFLSITTMLCMYDWILFRARPVTSFVEDVEESPEMPPLPEGALRDGATYIFRDVVGVYGTGDGQHKVCLPNVVIAAGVTILMGPSGAGKSTLLGVADGSVAYEGSVRLGGYELRDWDVSRKIVNASQSFGDMDVPLKNILGDDEKARDLALQCAAYSGADLEKSVKDLSGGQRRRAMLAAVVYHTLTGGFDDSVLFVDEPTNDLGRGEIKMLIAGFRKLAERLPNLAIVITTHEGRLVRLADQLIVLLGRGQARVKCREGRKLV